MLLCSIHDRTEKHLHDVILFANRMEAQSRASYRRRTNTSINQARRMVPAPLK